MTQGGVVLTSGLRNSALTETQPAFYSGAPRTAEQVDAQSKLRFSFKTALIIG